jgi:hypothetical protein
MDARRRQQALRDDLNATRRQLIAALEAAQRTMAQLHSSEEAVEQAWDNYRAALRNYREFVRRRMTE